MAVVINSLILKGISGKLGELVVKQYKGKTVVCTCPGYNPKNASKKQKKQRARFKMAVRWAKRVMANDHLLSKYEAEMKKGKSIFQYLVGEYLRAKDSL